MVGRNELESRFGELGLTSWKEKLYLMFACNPSAATVTTRVPVSFVHTALDSKKSSPASSNALIVKELSVWKVTAPLTRPEIVMFCPALTIVSVCISTVNVFNESAIGYFWNTSAVICELRPCET